MSCPTKKKGKDHKKSTKVQAKKSQNCRFDACYVIFTILKMRKHAQWAAHLDGWVGLSGVVALLSGDAARWTSLTLVPKPHAPLLWLLDDLYEGGWCCYVEARGVKEMWINCGVPGTQKTQHPGDETPAFSAALLESVHQRKNNSISVSIFTNPCGHYQCWFIQNADHLLEAASYLGWVSSGSIHSRLWWTENKNRCLTDWSQSPRVTSGLPSTLYDIQHIATAQEHKPKRYFQHILVVL